MRQRAKSKKEEIIKLLQSGVKSPEIVEITGVTRQQVSRIAKSIGVKLKSDISKKQLILAALDKGITSSEIMKKIGVTRQHISRVAKTVNIDIKEHNQRQSNQKKQAERKLYDIFKNDDRVIPDRNILISEYKSNKSLEWLANKYGFSVGWIRKQLDGYVEFRKQGRPKKATV